MTLTDEVVRQSEAAGFRLPGSVVEPELPADPTVLATNVLMQHMAAYTALVAYAASEWSIADTKATEMAARYKVARSRAYLQLRGEKRSEEERKALLESDEELVALKQDEIVASSYATLVKALREGFEGKYALLSRELTRRGIASERRFD